MGFLRATAFVGAFTLAACGGSEVVPPTPPAATATTTAAAASGPILMTVRGWHMSKDHGSRGPLAIGDTLHSGDFFSYYVRVDRDAYVYVLQFFADGSAKVLFPEAGDARLFADQETRVPTDGSQWFQLDDARGVEHLYVIAAATPLKDSAPALAELIGNVRTSPNALAKELPRDEDTPPVGSAGAKVRVPDADEMTGRHDLVPDGGVPRPQPIARLDPSARARAIALGGPHPLERRYQVHFRGAELVQVDVQGSVAYQGSTDQTGVGIAHFPFRHD